VSSKTVNATVLHAHGEATEATAIITHDEVKGKVLHKKEAIKL
jgi:hypothetical protein